MNLISCDKCGVVLDANKANFPDDIYDEAGCIDGSKVVWNGEAYVAFIRCPVCQSRILQET